MFRTITRLLFGGEEDTPQEVKCGEVLEEEWLLVSHQGQFSSIKVFISMVQYKHMQLDVKCKYCELLNSCIQIGVIDEHLC